MDTIKLNKAEIQSRLDRVRFAENLIMQLPEDHEGRNTWLLNYGRSPEAQQMRTKRDLKFDSETLSCELANTIYKH